MMWIAAVAGWVPLEDPETRAHVPDEKDLREPHFRRVRCGVGRLMFWRDWPVAMVGGNAAVTDGIGAAS